MIDGRKRISRLMILFACISASVCFFVTVNLANAQYLKAAGTKTCVANGCHTSAYAPTTFEAGINVGGTPTDYDLTNTPVIDVPQGGTFEIDWHFTGLADSGDATTGLAIEVPNGWGVSAGTIGSIPSGGNWGTWNTTWWDQGAAIGWDPVGVSATIASSTTHTGYLLNFGAAGTPWNTNGEGVAINNSGSATGLPDSDGQNQHLGADATITVPGTATINSQHDIIIIGAGYNTNTKSYVSGTIKVRVVAGSGNNAPVFTSTNSASYAENGTGVVKTITTTDTDGDPVAFTIVGGTDQADFTLQNASAGTGSASVELVFNAVAFPSGPDFENPADSDTNNTYQVTIRASDGTTTTDQIITVTVTDLNDPPVAVDDSDTTLQDAPLDPTVNVLTNDTDQDAGDTLSISAFDATSAQGGTVSSNGDGTFAYTPAAAFTGSDTFNYTVSDGTTTDVGTVTITVNANSAPVAPSTVKQYRTAGAGGTEIAKGTYTNEATIEFKDAITDPDGGNVTLEVEIKLVGDIFDGTVDCSDTVISGSTATAVCTQHSGGTALADGQKLMWRARTNDGSKQSAWVNY